MQTCAICKHKQRESIDRAIIERASERTIAARFGISKTALHRHKANVRELARVDIARRAETVATEITRAEDRVENLYMVVENVLKAAVSARDPKAALQAIRTSVGVLAEARALAELRGVQEAQPMVPGRDQDQSGT